MKKSKPASAGKNCTFWTGTVAEAVGFVFVVVFVVLVVSIATPTVLLLFVLSVAVVLLLLLLIFTALCSEVASNFDIGGGTLRGILATTAVEIIDSTTPTSASSTTTTSLFFCFVWLLFVVVVVAAVVLVIIPVTVSSTPALRFTNIDGDDADAFFGLDINFSGGVTM